jgi:very-short-patch-repair endonuclease
MDEFVDLVARRGGVLHTRDARLEGFTTHGLRRAVASGVVTRVRKSWLVAPTCDPESRRAVECGGRLTCLTAARRRGLWTPTHARIHLAVPPTASRVGGADVKLHWSRGPAPVAPTAATDEVLNILFHVARCAQPKDALAVWESAVRTRQVDPALLHRVDWRSSAAKGLAAVSSALSDSGVETRFLVLMRSIGVTVRQQVGLLGHPVDGLIGRRLVVQLDGFAHHQAADRRRDLRHDAQLLLRGYTVLRFDYFQVLFSPDEVTSTVAMAVAQGLHR